jgi:serine-type D-Ala-D-Ala carboxypeptidase/endopeptidase (penicillin-binding protein 4)
VSSPTRRGQGPGPLLVLACAVLIPAIVLFATYRWADAQITESAPAPEAPPVTGPAAEQLAAPMFTMRRMSTVVSRALSIDAFRAAVEGYVPSLNERSCVAVSVDGEPVASKNADIAVIPASTQKLLVASVALDQLGEGFQFSTRALAGAQPVGGAIQGDLYLIGTRSSRRRVSRRSPTVS